AIGVLLKTLKRARTNVQQPLASTLNWNKWDCSLEVAMWIYGFCRHAKHHMKDPAPLPIRFFDVYQSSKAIAMVRPLNEWRYNGVERGVLAVFIEETGEI